MQILNIFLKQKATLSILAVTLVFSSARPAQGEAMVNTDWLSWISQPVDFDGKSVQDATDLLPLLLNQNSQVRSAYAAWQAMLAAEGTVSGLPDPTLTVGAFLAPVETAVGPQNYKVSLSQSIPWRKKTSARRDQLQAKTGQSYQGLSAVVLEKTRELRLLGNEAGFVNAMIDLSEEKLSLAQDLDVILGTTYSSGGTSHAVLINEQIRTRLIQDQLNGFEDRLRRVSIELSSLLELDTLLDVSRMRTSSVPTKLPELSGDFQSHPRILGLHSLIQETEAQSDLAKATFYPDLRVGFDYILTGNKQVNGIDVPNSGQDPIVFTVGTQIPLWNWKQNRAQLAAAEWQKKQAEAMLDRELRTSRQRESINLSKLEEDLRTFKLYEAVLIPQTTEKMQVIEQSYITDGSDIRSYVNAQQAVLDLKIQLETTRRSILDQLAELSYWKGE